MATTRLSTATVRGKNRTACPRLPNTHINAVAVAQHDCLRLKSQARNEVITRLDCNCQGNLQVLVNLVIKRMLELKAKANLNLYPHLI
eukprot:scaffold232286_cov66-Cyclotella_meneghiniana.AAC.2